MGPGALRTVFRIKGGLLCLGFVPIVPSFRLYVAIHKTVYNHGFGMVPPRPPEIKCTFFCIPGQATVDEDQSVFTLLFGRGRSEVSIVLGINLTFLKNGRGPTEDKIHRSLNITVFIILSGTVPLHVESILKTQKPAVFKDHLIGADTNGHRLPDFPSIPGTVPKTYVPRLESVSEHKE